MNRVHFIVCLSASLLMVGTTSVVGTSSVNVTASSFTRNPSSLLIHPSSFIPHPFLKQQPAQATNPEALKKYIGRYALDAGIIPISTLDVTLENNELWVKPSVVKKRRLVHKSRTVFLDEIEGTPLTFNKDADGKIASVTFLYEGESYTAPRVVLPPASLKGNTTFRLKGHPHAMIVALAGSFNSWNQSQFIFGREGDEWICRVDLEPGKHAYKFIVDGNWLLDPDNPETEDDDYGVKNSVIVILKSHGQLNSPLPVKSKMLVAAMLPESIHD